MNDIQFSVHLCLFIISIHVHVHAHACTLYMSMHGHSFRKVQKHECYALINARRACAR